MFHILVVDDDRNTRRYMRAVLEAADYTVSEAADGVEALKMMEKEYVDLVVLDILMPEMDGYEFTETLRKRFEGWPEFEIVSVRGLGYKAVKHV